MITMKDIQEYEQLKINIEIFLRNRCIEMEDVKVKYGESNWIIGYLLEDRYECYNIKNSNIEVEFYNSWYAEFYTLVLPLDILFEPDFKDKMEVRLKDELEAKRLKKLEEERQAFIRKQEREEAKKEEEKLLMFTLIEKYKDDPDIKGKLL